MAKIGPGPTLTACMYTPPICITIHLPFVLRYLCRNLWSGAVGTPPRNGVAVHDAKTASHCATTCASGLKKGVFPRNFERIQKGGFVKGWFWRIIRNVPSFRFLIPSFSFLCPRSGLGWSVVPFLCPCSGFGGPAAPANICQNHPFGKPSLREPPKRDSLFPHSFKGTARFRFLETGPNNGSGFKFRFGS